MICTVSDCEKNAIAKGLCPKHYARQRNGQRLEDDIVTITSNEDSMEKNTQENLSKDAINPIAESQSKRLARLKEVKADAEYIYNKRLRDQLENAEYEASKRK